MKLPTVGNIHMNGTGCYYNNSDPSDLVICASRPRKKRTKKELTARDVAKRKIVRLMKHCDQEQLEKIVADMESFKDYNIKNLYYMIE